MPGTPAISPKRAARLKTKKHREAERLFLAEGAAILEEAPTAPLQVFDRVVQLRRVSTLKTPSGPVGVFPFLDVAATELLACVRRVVLLHGVQDPGNVGTAIRSAHAFGAGVALSRGSADLYNPKTVRASMGSIFHTPVARELESVELPRHRCVEDGPHRRPDRLWIVEVGGAPGEGDTGAERVGRADGRANVPGILNPVQQHNAPHRGQQFGCTYVQEREDPDRSGRGLERRNATQLAHFIEDL